MRCCDLTSGKLRISAQLQRLTNTSDGGGGYTTTWTSYASIKVHFEQTSGVERISATRLDAVTRNRAYMRYRPDIKEADRMILGGRAYNIRSIINMEMRDQWLQLDLDGGVAT
jgi:SPP1 family predicted phage head-tail adaptor